jgi:hypothetical protein
MRCVFCNFAEKIFSGEEILFSLFLLEFLRGVGELWMFFDGTLLVRLWSLRGELWTGDAS